MGPIHSVADLIDLIRRRLGVIVALTLVGMAFSLVFAMRQPRIFQASEVLQIERPKIASGLAPSTVESSSARRLQLIEQQLMARDNLLDMIAKFGLFADAGKLNQTELTDLMRRSVNIEGVAAVREGFADDGTISVLTFTARLGDPLQAQQVAQEMAARTIALSAQTRSDQTRETLDFFLREEDRLTSAVAAFDDQIAKFSTDNDLTVTGNVDLRRSEIASVNGAMLDIDRESIGVQLQIDQVDRAGRQAAVDREIAGFQAQLDSLASQRALLEQRAASLAEVLVASPEIERQLSSFQRDRDQLQSQLDVVLTRRAEAEVGFRLEQNLQGERLTILEPATVPEYSITSSRKKLAAMGAVLSGLAALAVAFLLDLRHPVLRSVAQMERETGLRPVVAIPQLDRPGRVLGPMQRLRAALGKPA